jgi:hypothetical protein
MLNKFYICIFTLPCLLAHTWEDDPRWEEHNRLTERLIKLGNEQNGIEEKPKTNKEKQDEKISIDKSIFDTSVACDCGRRQKK